MANLWPERTDSPAGKGQKPRPYSVSMQEYGEKYDRIFNNDEENKDKEEEEE